MSNENKPSTFLNVDLDGRTPFKFIWKHFLFGFLWLTAILIIFFRVDVIVFERFNIHIRWLEGTLPIIIIILVGLTMITQKWYYSLALFFYPALAIGWFIPKAVLRKGKMYLFLRYINYVFNLFKKFKLTILHFGLFSFAVIIPLMIGNTWAKYFSLAAFIYFYARFTIRYLKNSFRPAQLFGSNVEKFMDGLIQKSKNNESFLITTFVLQNDKTEDLTPEKINKRLTRLILLNYALDTVIHRMNGFRGKRAFMIALLYELFIFLVFSILFLWTCNFLLYKADPNSFKITGLPNVFDFLYYSIKNIAFSSIDSIIPMSWSARILEIIAFGVVSVFVLIIVISMIFSLRNDKINENVKLTTSFCADQNRVIKEFAITTYGKDLQSAMAELANIHDSLKKLRDVIDKLF